MFVVTYYENRNVLLTQLLKSLPEEGQNVKIKGRKGKITNIAPIDEKNVHVYVALEAVNKNKLVALDNSKKKKR
ncbi:hypothetical protein M3175_19235 [Robertmurraya korlensis]|uniref:hypothetical protein n=1 Tax=Robertmurraya korlensis TaxID=519977 RepID=UPI00203FBA62|nr:hypothetical protein [Robertmurraya korlensis]MCM3602874.1 hypothetical protein [Robertmurraya korlensis]